MNKADLLPPATLNKSQQKEWDQFFDDLDKHQQDAGIQVSYQHFAAGWQNKYPDRPIPSYEGFLVGWVLGRADFAAMF